MDIIQQSPGHQFSGQAQPNAKQALAHPLFGRDLTAPEWQSYRKTIQQAKDALDIRHLGLITPIRSLPVDTRTGVGNLPGAKEFFKFLTSLGFDMVQVDPEGKTKLVDASPYTGTVFSTNPLYIDLKDLVENPAWAGILSKKELADLEAGNPNPDGARVAYEYIYQAQEKVLKSVYDTYQAKLKNVDQLPAGEASAVRDIERRFAQFVQNNAGWLESDALYEALSVEYDNDYWPQWKGPNAALDKNLYNPKDAAQAAEAEQRKAELKQKYADVIGAYEFAQFIVAEQKHGFKDFAKAQGFALMADRQVGFSDRDVWAYQRLFLPGWSLGCPPDFFSKTGQAWGFPVLDPEQLFKPDGSLGEGGQLLKRLFEKIFEENPGGVRIDHIIGLIDPWVYPAGMPHTKTGGRLYSSPERPELAKYALVDINGLDQNYPNDDEKRVSASAMDPVTVTRYARILDHIVLAAAREKGIPNESIICEDLGTMTTPVRAVLEQRGLSGIRVSQFANPKEPDDIFRLRNTQSRHWVTPGTHDNEPILMWSKRLVQEAQDGAPDAWLHAEKLAEDLLPDPNERAQAKDEMARNPLALAKAKFVEVLSSPARQVQLFFADLFGIEEVYNRPGTSGGANWSLRVPPQFTDAYYQAVREGKAPNVPEIMLEALKAKNIQNPTLANELKRYADIIKS